MTGRLGQILDNPTFLSDSGEMTVYLTVNLLSTEGVSGTYQLQTTGQLKLISQFSLSIKCTCVKISVFENLGCSLVDLELIPDSGTI